MSGSDSFELVIHQIARDLGSVKDTFALIGMFYAGKLTFNCLSSLYYGFKTYILSSVCKNDKWMRELGEWAVVTGCTHGIGLAYCRELAKRKINLILVARNAELLQKVSSAFEEKYGIETIIVVADLSDTRNFETIENALADKDIGVLINNAAYSHEAGLYHTISDESIDKVLNVNVRSTLFLTKLVLPGMLRKNKGAIVNVSSVIAFIPGNFFSVYGAGKALIDKFTETLQYEYRKTNLVIQCLNPGPVKTQATVKAGGRKVQRMKLDAVKFVASSIRTLGFSKNTCGYWGHGLLVTIASLLPRSVFHSIYFNALEKSFQKQIVTETIPGEFHYDDLEIILKLD